MIRGYTLVELLITIAIVSLFSLTSISFLGSIQQRSTLQVDTARIFHGLALARSEAITRNQTIGICGTLDQQHCSTNWSKGFMVFAKNKDNMPPAVSDILFQETYHSGITIHSHARSLFAFSPDGRSLNGTIDLILNQKTITQVVLLNSGRCRIQQISS